MAVTQYVILSQTVLLMITIDNIISNLEIAETLIRRTLLDDLTTTKGSPYFNDAEVGMLTDMAMQLWMLRCALKPPPNP
jgi:hypothetical protein